MWIEALYGLSGNCRKFCPTSSGCCEPRILAGSDSKTHTGLPNLLHKHTHNHCIECKTVFFLLIPLEHTVSWNIRAIALETQQYPDRSPDSKPRVHENLKIRANLPLTRQVSSVSFCPIKFLLGVGWIPLNIRKLVSCIKDYLIRTFVNTSSCVNPPSLSPCFLLDYSWTSWRDTSYWSRWVFLKPF